MSSRAAGLLALLLAVMYATAYLVAYTRDWDFSLFWSTSLPLALALVPLLALILIARGSSLSSASFRLLWSFLAACGCHLLWLVATWWLAEQGHPWWSLPSAAEEMGHGYWRTFFVLAWMAVFARIHPPARPATLALSVVPLLVWGIESTSSHLGTFHGTLPFKFYWLLAATSALALVSTLCAIGLWRWLAGAPPLRRGALFAGLVTILTVLFDWGFTLCVITSAQAEADAEPEARAPVVECEPAALTLPEQEVQSDGLRASFRPLLVGCAATVRCLSAEQKEAAARRLAEVVAADIQGEYDRRDLTSRWQELADLVEEHLGCSVAEEVILTGFTLERPRLPSEVASAGSEPMWVGGEVVPPKRLRGDSAALRPLSSKYGHSVCIVQTVVTREGRLEEVELLKPESCAPEPKRVIEEMFESWLFRPAFLGGEPVAVNYYLTIDHCPCVERGSL